MKSSIRSRLEIGSVSLVSGWAMIAGVVAATAGCFPDAKNNAQPQTATPQQSDAAELESVAEEATPATLTVDPGEAASASNTPPPMAVAPFDAAQARRYQLAWADCLDAPVEITNVIGMPLVLIPPGEFMMGTSREEFDEFLQGSPSETSVRRHRSETPQHRVRIAQPFYLGKCEVTVGQFRRFVEASGYQTWAEYSGQGGAVRNFSTRTYESKPEHLWNHPESAPAENYPVSQVCWRDADQFCKWLSKEEGAAYQLPTEAMWEYACRAGTITVYSSGDSLGSLQGVANLADISHSKQYADETSKLSWDDGYPNAAPVGQFRANPFGLHDMNGNLREWCQDRWADDYYSQSPADDPPGPPTGERRVVRGAGFDTVATRSAGRTDAKPDGCLFTIGFRVARTIP